MNWIVGMILLVGCVVILLIPDSEIEDGTIHVRLVEMKYSPDGEIFALSLFAMAFFTFYFLWFVIPFEGLFVFENGICVPSFTRKVIPWKLISQISHYRKDDRCVVRIELRERFKDTRTVEVEMDKALLQPLQSTVVRLRKGLWREE